MANILNLPAELIVHIFTFLSDTDILATRLTNKHIESSSLSYFGKRLFRKKGYLLTTPSLAVLKAIANHEELRKHVQHLWLNPDCYTNVQPECAPVDSDGDDETSGPALLSVDDRRKHAAYEACVTDHARLLYTPQLTAELTEAFAKLPNLLTIGMRRSEKYRPCGWRLLLETIGEDPRRLGPIPSGPKVMLQAPTKLFVAIVNALAASGVELKRLYTDVVEVDNILPAHLTQATMERALRSVLYLEVNVARAWLNGWTKASENPHKTCKDEADWGTALTKLINAVPNLLELGLQIFPDPMFRFRGQAMMTGLLQHRYPYAAFRAMAMGAALRNLTRLKLEKITSDSSTLETFLAPSRRTLTSVKMREIRLLSPQDSEDSKKPWHPILAFLRDSCPNLAYVLLHNLRHQGGGVSFVADPTSVIQPTPRAPGPASFVQYEHITLEADGREAVERELHRVVERHWYEKPLHSYPMDEEVWHTDTSDEEW